MSITLYEHNENAYYAAFTMLRETGKATVIHPTGTGKSFIGFKFCEDFPEKNICWLSPSEYIFRTQLDNLAADSGIAPENITFLTYARLMTLDDADINAIHPDLIILDEFHRCGAEQWGKGVQALLNTYPDAPLLGLSATNIRFLDNQRDMADELFDGHIASEMTLGEAIARNILKPPKYILSVYSFQKDIERYEGRVAKLRDPVRRDRAMDLLKTLRRNLEESDGLDAVFARHMPDRNGRYIVFCSSMSHMNRMISYVPEWFSSVDPNPHIYRAYSPDPATQAEFEKFRTDESDHLKLLFTIDMLNEGIHVTDVDGVILFRPTVSPIIYKQQIGRALSAGSEKTPVIFDVVNNIENLTSIGALERDFEDAVLRTGGTEQERRELLQRFQIIDEVRDCRQLFERLNDALAVSWEDMYQYAKSYYETHGDLRVPAVYKTADGYSLGAWIRTQRAIRKGTQHGALSEEQIAKLDAIGMFWTVRKKEDRWEEYYAAAEKYAAEYGNLKIPNRYMTPDGLPLGTWSKMMRQLYKAGRLDPSRAERLEAIGMVWTVEKVGWERWYQAAATYRQEHGNLDILSNYVTPDGLKLGSWLVGKRQEYKEGVMKPERISQLEALGISWNQNSDQWDKFYRSAQEYYQEHGDIRPGPSYISPDGIRLGQWILRCRRDYKKGVLSESRVAQLESIGMIWDPRAERWERNYRAAMDYYQTHGDLKVPAQYVDANGVGLDWWLKHVRKAYRDGALDREQIGRLEAIGMIWDPRVEQWEKNYQAALTYFRTHGDLKVPCEYTDSDGLNLGQWIRHLRQAYRDGTLTDERISKLEDIGMIWDTTDRRRKVVNLETQYGSVDTLTG